MWKKGGKHLHMEIKALVLFKLFITGNENFTPMTPLANKFHIHSLLLGVENAWSVS